ncbi:regulatory protein RecX [Varunaivibrio sulfuroxidans]|uniref:Regulatory protein RecX n=1 Tax=Varunaivibrio sulfuroxidans TaxID=1773489 RepID=A0A4R3JGC0_9PROT|nr:regulatory protein RecX [Varunaivibrio sulfuroxidans]TCS64974.1 regulatory protein [Varunaivibrio sulfuroxidans]WES29735.1 regulatory protein RecX [Varunaivibrio sulfuroxidans]
MKREKSKKSAVKNTAASRVREVTPRYLENAALYYLERFASSAANLRAVLMRKVVKSAYHHGADPKEGETWVDALIARFVASGLLDDRAYAEARVASLRRQGNSARAIRAKLLQKGVDGELIEEALKKHGAGEELSAQDEEFEAALRFARRRRLGSFAPAATRAVRRDKDMAALARAGFSYDTARRIIDAVPEDPEA